MIGFFEGRFLPLMVGGVLLLMWNIVNLSRIKRACSCGGESFSTRTTEQRQTFGLSSMNLAERIKAFETAAAKAADPEEMAAKISEFSDRKKYNFVDGLQRDVIATRSALRAVSEDGASATFGDLYKVTEGEIANLNKVLMNLKKAGELKFAVEMFYEGMSDNEIIEMQESFFKSEYSVDQENAFRPGRNQKDVPREERLGRSYIAENLNTKGVTDCVVCGERVLDINRLTIRGQVYHLNCVKCVQCGAPPRDKQDFVTFDGSICCSSECIKLYDAANLKQSRS